MILLPEEYFLISGNDTKNLMTIFHMYEKMELFFVFNMTHLKFVCGLDHCKCTGRTSKKTGYLKSIYRR